MIVLVSTCSSCWLAWSNLTLYYGQVAEKIRDLKLIFGMMASTLEVIYLSFLDFLLDDRCNVTCLFGMQLLISLNCCFLFQC
jgi:hypothetical protein